jgi:hypothetical protein
MVLKKNNRNKVIFFKIQFFKSKYKSIFAHATQRTYFRFRIAHTAYCARLNYILRNFPYNHFQVIYPLQSGNL